MIHEILMYLWSDTNNLLDFSQDANIQALQEYLHPGEVGLLQAIIDIVADHHAIVAFIKQPDGRRTRRPRNTTTSNNSNNNKDGGSDNSLYLKAFRTGLDRALNDYRDQIVQLETMFLDNPQLSLTYVLSAVKQYETLFRDLRSIVVAIERDKLHGCVLTGMLHKYTYCGIDCLQCAAKTIILAINCVFYRDLCNWIIYGDLIEMCNEFFIRDGKCADMDFLYLEQIEQQQQSQSSSNVKQHIGSSSTKRQFWRPPIVRKFSIDWSMVPDFINKDTAERILFMGRIVWILRNDPRPQQQQVAVEAAATQKVSASLKIWNGNDYEWYKRIQMLELQSPHNTAIFQKTINDTHIQLTSFLRSIMMDDGNLIEHLHLIRDFYALGRGELFQQLIDGVSDEIVEATFEQQQEQQVPQRLITHLNAVFLENARKIYGENNDRSYMRFELAATNICKDDDDDDNDTTTTTKNPIMGTNNFWSYLQLNFAINWPLHIVFHPKAIELYNKLFCYLLRLKKTQMGLDKLWQSHVSGKLNVDRRVMMLRQHLTFLINNLHYYLQVDVIETEFALLFKQIGNANEFKDIIKIHNEFISNLLTKTFILMPDEVRGETYENATLYQMPAVQLNVPSKVYNVIVRLMELCDEFCVVANTWDVIELTAPNLIDFEQFQIRTEVIVDALIIILNKLSENVIGEHILQLLYQLDFNRYFSEKFNQTL